MVKSKSLKESLVLWILTAILLAVIFIPTTRVHAQGGTEHNNVVTGAKLTKSDLKSPPGKVSQWSQMQLVVNFALPNNVVHAGDKTVIPIPNELKVFRKENFEIKNPNGQLVANAVTDPATKTVTMTYTDFVEKHSDVTGFLHVTVMVDKTVVTVPKIIKTKIDMGIGNPKFDLDQFEFLGIGGNDNPNEELVKYSWFDENDPTIIHCRIRINGKGGNYSNYILTDELMTADATYIKDRMFVEKGKWEVNSNGFFVLKNKQNVTNQFQPAYTGKGFTINFGNINGEGYHVGYAVKLGHKPVNQENVKNKIVAEATGIQKITRTAEALYQESEGEANGYTFTIKIHKESEDGTKLKGAEFNVKRVASNEIVGKITTDTDGVGSIGGLLKDNYELEEITAPSGHLLLGEKIKITPADFGSDKVALKKVVNKKIPKIEISGEKTWDDGNNQDGKRPGKIVVNLLADGSKVAEKEVVPDANGIWKYSFTNLPKFKNGKEIKYTVTENAVEGYTTEVNGYDIKNRHKPSETSVKVTKRWDDANDKDKIRPGSVKIQLYANGEKVGNIVELTAADKWTYTWSKLPEMKDGKKIKYTVKEVGKIEGYTVSIDDKNPGDIVITNTHKPKLPPPPNTGDSNNLMSMLAGLITSMAIALLMFKKRATMDKQS